MTRNRYRPRQTGRLTACLLAMLLAAAMAGCGGGGGGGGGGTSPTPPPGGGTSETLLISQAITTTGGTVGSVAANGIQIGIPGSTSLNGSTTNYTVSIYTLPTSSAPTLPAGQTLVSPIFDVRSKATNGQPDGGVFSQNVNFYIQPTATLTSSQLAQSNIWYYDTTSSTWQLLATNPNIAPIAGTANGSNTALTYYALFTPPLPGTP